MQGKLSLQGSSQAGRTLRGAKPGELPLGGGRRGGLPEERWQRELLPEGRGHEKDPLPGGCYAGPGLPKGGQEELPTVALPLGRCVRE